LGLSLIAPLSLIVPVSLLAASSLAELAGTLIVILEVAAALGLVIFVHELGHFAVAKWCGVKCEKFYLGFDIAGLKLFKYQWGETEYGIGILPLGGYVKMLGQDDNPGRAAEERQRSIIADHGEPNLDDVAETGRVASGQHAEKIDPRSYLAKSVPQRMAIISAGVIMNLIFAFIFAVIAFMMGAPDMACVVSDVRPGEPAWRANIEPGDEIVQINGSTGPLRWRDLMAAVALGNMEKGVEFTIERPGVEEQLVFNVHPDKVGSRLVPTIGVSSPRTTTLDRKPIVNGDSPAGSNVDQFEQGDKIVAVNGTKVETFPELEAQLLRHVDEEVSLTIERKVGDDPKADEVKILDVKLPTRPMQTLGLVMTMGEITAIQAKGPAEEAGLRPGDKIVSIDGAEPGDPLRLPDQLRVRAGETVKLVVERPKGSGSETIEKEITLRDRPWPEESSFDSNPVSVPSLGLTYKVLAKVREIVSDSPAAKAELTKDGEPATQKSFAPGDEIVAASLELVDPTSDAEKASRDDNRVAWPDQAPGTLKFSADDANWPYLMWLLQVLPHDTKVTLELADGRQAALTSAAATDWNYYDRGLRPGPMMTIVQAQDFSQALSLGWRETVDSLLMVYRFLGKIGTQVSPMSMGGPVTIAQAAGGAASEGIPTLLLFLTMLSANLAVINFLPIPLLDGGHMVFLALEGILRRPVSEKVVIAFHYAGFVFIISLMLFVLGLDVSRLI